MFKLLFIILKNPSQDVLFFIVGEVLKIYLVSLVLVQMLNHNIWVYVSFFQRFVGKNTVDTRGIFCTLNFRFERS